MHGRPRITSGDQDPERVRAAQQKAALLGQLLAQVLTNRRERRYDPASLSLSAKLLELNPEVYTVWNYRREAVTPVLQAGGDAAVEAVAAELALTQRAFLRNPKSYATWHHRKWAVATGCCSLERELALVVQLLEADERNFHGWSYRSFIAQRMGMPAARELEFTRQKIEQNFSNYSAWHYRTRLLPVMYSAGGEGDRSAQLSELLDESKASSQGGEDQRSPAAATAAVPAAVLEEEYELVQQAFYTEPEDQSGWFYHRWLLGCSLARYNQCQGGPGEGAERDTLLHVLAAQAAMCQELLDIEPAAKWPLLTLTRLRELQAQLQRQAGGEARATEGEVEVQEGYTTLAAVDKLREGYYQDAAAGKAHVVTMPQAGGGDNAPAV